MIENDGNFNESVGASRLQFGLDRSTSGSSHGSKIETGSASY
jgi:hypothetical protein